MADRRTRLLIGSAGLIALIGGSSCVYFNTYYNAEKYFRQAEKARAEAELHQTRTPTPTLGGRSSRGNRSGNYLDLYDKAVRKASIVLEKFPESELVDDAMFLAGRALYWQRDYQYGARSFQDLENHFPESEYVDRARLWRGRCLQQMGSSGEARALFSALVLERSGVGDQAGLRLGEMAVTDGDLRAAIAEFQGALAAFPETRLADQLWLRIGDAHLALDGAAHLDSALIAFDRSLESSPVDSVHYRARLHRGRVLYRQGRPEEALTTYQGLLRDGRFRTWEGETRILIGQYYRERGSLPQALNEFERVRDDFPGTDVSALALYHTGLLYLQDHGERRRSQEYFREVSEEKRGSQADSLARVMLKTADELDILLDAIFVADSTAATQQLPAVDEDREQEGDQRLEPVGSEAELDDAATVVLADTTILGGALPTVTADTAMVDSAAPGSGTVAMDGVEAPSPSSESVATADSAVTIPDSATVASPDAPEGTALALADTAVASTDSISTHAPARPRARTGKKPKEPAALVGYQAAADSLGRWVPLVSRPSWEEDDDAEGQGQNRRRSMPPRRHGSGPPPTLLDNLFSAAEIYRDEMGLADSAVVLFAAIADRYPASEQVPRALYNLAWTHLEERADSASARPILERLVSDHPATEHANAARAYLGLPEQRTFEDEAREIFAELERVRLENPQAPEQWLPRFDELAERFAGTTVAVRAEYLAAWATENVVGDSAAAAARYDSIRARIQGGPFSDMLEQRRLAERDGLVERLERSLRSLSEGVGPGERLVIVAVEPSGEDSTELAQKFLGFGMRALRRGDLTAAEELFQLSLDEKQSGNSDARVGLGEVSWRLGYATDAVDHMRRALKERARSNLPHYRLYAHHLREGQVDSVNKYLRTIARRDRLSPAVSDLILRFPTIATAEPEIVEVEDLETVFLEPDETSLLFTPAYFGITEPPIVRALLLPEYPAGRTDTATVVVDVLISKNGRPEQVDVYSGDEPFATAAHAAVGEYVFYPAEGRSQSLMSVWVEVEIPFAPQPVEVASRPGDALPAPTDSAATSTAEADQVPRAPDGE